AQTGPAHPTGRRRGARSSMTCRPTASAQSLGTRPSSGRPHDPGSSRLRAPGPASRFATGVTAAVLAASGLAACTPGDTAQIEYAAGGETLTPSADDAAQATSAASQATYSSADVVAVGPADSAEAVAAISSDLRIPALLGDPAQVEDELTRLDAGTVLVPAGTSWDTGEERDTLEFAPADLSVDGDAPEIENPDAEAPVTLFLDPTDADGPAVTVARASVEAAGGAVVEAPGADPRATSDTVAAAQEAEGDTVVAIGEGF